MAAAVALERTGIRSAEQPAVVLPIHEKRWVVALYRMLTAISPWLIVGTIVFTPNLKPGGFPIQFFLCLGIIIFCGKVRGKQIYARTPVDFAFVTWLGVAVASQIWASVVLNRVLQYDDFLGYLVIILTSWFVFRAAFALCCVDPRTATGAFLKSILFCLGGACVIGILQGYGPGPLKTWAINFGVNYGSKGDATAMVQEVANPRPVALFSGPNYFGFMNLIGMCILIGMTVAQGKSISTKAVWGAAFGLATFLVGTLVAQSRFAILTALILIGCFFWLMIKIGQTKVVITGAVAVGAVLVAGLLFVQQMDLTYLESTFQKKITDDNSFQERQLGFDYLVDQAIDLAPLGSGFDSHGFILDRTGDVWSKTNSIDNGYLQAYINHGIPGVLQLMFLFWSLWWGIKLAKRHKFLHIRTLRVVAGMLLATYMLYSLSGVRHAKLETCLYWMMIFGLLYGSLYGEKFFGEPYRKAISALPAPRS